MKKKKLNLLERKFKPLVGNSRSFSNIASKRKFYGNVQNLKINGKKYKVTVRDFRNHYFHLVKL